MAEILTIQKICTSVISWNHNSGIKTFVYLQCCMYYQSEKRLPWGTWVDCIVFYWPAIQWVFRDLIMSGACLVSEIGFVLGYSDPFSGFNRTHTMLYVWKKVLTSHTSMQTSCILLHVWLPLFGKPAQQRQTICEMSRPHGGHVMCISARLLGFEGRMDSGAWVLMVTGESSSLILKDNHHYATVLINHM